MVFEFEGRTEKEAIDRAAEELGLEKDDFDVEILETQKHGLFKKGYVRIKVHTGNLGKSAAVNANDFDENRKGNYTGKAAFGEPAPQGDFEEKMTEFTAGLIDRMGYPGKVTVLFRDKNKLGLKIDSAHSSILIGKKGKNLDALQLLLNIYAGRRARII